jgi:hypothetical protein
LRVAIIKGFVDPAALPPLGDGPPDVSTTPQGLLRVPLAFVSPTSNVHTPGGEDEFDSDEEPDDSGGVVAAQRTMLGGDPTTTLSLASAGRESSRSPRRASTSHSVLGGPSLRRGTPSVAGSATSRVVAGRSERFERFSGTPADRQSNAIA